jgi:hypothetical protein
MKELPMRKVLIPASVIALIATVLSACSTMQKIIFPGGMALLLCAGLALGVGCSKMDPETLSRVQSIADQAPGAVDAFVDVALAMPLDADTHDKVAGWGTMAKLGTRAAVGITDVLTKPEGATHAAGAVTAISDLVKAAPIPEASKTNAINWAGWSLTALKAVATLLPLIL